MTESQNDPLLGTHDSPVFRPAGCACDGATAEQATTIANLAMHAVYEWCSRTEAFHGASFEADYKNYQRVFSNVGVHLADPGKAQGHVLWYQVFFVGNKPVSFQATKAIAAELAGLPGKDIEVDLALQ